MGVGARSRWAAVGLGVALTLAACGTDAPRASRPTTTTSLGGTAPTGTIDPAAPGDTPAGSDGLPAPAPDDSASRVPMTGYRADLRRWDCPFSKATTGGIKADCYTLAVPESRTDPGSRQIRLAVAVLHSTSPRPRADPIVFLQGGPGGSAVADVELWTQPPSPWLGDRDLVLVDQRGTGYSSPRLTCTGVTTSADNSYSEDLDAAFLRQCTSRLRAQQVVLGAYNTDESAADVEDLRRALGIGYWNLYGASYGTRLALAVMDQHPTAVRSAVIDSVYPPGVHAWEEESAIIWGALTNLFRDCAAQPACARAYPDLQNRFLQTVDRLDRVDRPVGTYQGRRVRLSGNGFVRLVLHALYNSPNIVDVPRALDAAYQGDIGTALSILTRTVPEARAATTGADAGATDAAGGDPVSRQDRPYMTEAIFYTISCAEEAPNNTAAGIDAVAATVPIQVARPVAADAKVVLASCDDWRVPRRSLRETRVDIPTLVVGGPYDPVTPLSWARAAQANLPNSRLVAIPGAGHGTVLAGDCPVALMQRFFDDPASMGGDDCGTAPPAFRTG